MDFSRCKRISIRGYNHARLTSVITKDIKDCNAFDPLLIVPNKVVDAVGKQQYDIGKTNVIHS